MITIYSSHLSSRLQYAVDVVFTQILGLEVNLTNQKENLKEIVINYSDEKIKAKSFHISPNGLLFSEKIYSNVDDVEINQRDRIRIFSRDDDFGFDILSAVFFLITRMEEYNSIDLDSHKRFKHTNSILFNYDVLDFPIVDLWAFNLLSSINSFFNQSLSSNRQFINTSTIDIDNAYAYRHKGFLRTFGASLKSLVKLDFSVFMQRFRVLFLKEKDPYDNYEYLKQFIEKEKIKLTVFILLADYNKYDKNLNYKNESFINLIKHLSSFSNIGIHPSYNSYDNLKNISVEINRLENINSFKVNDSRNHFLRFKIPETFQKLLECGVKNDHSMGYANIPGFRAGTCTPFYFYDLIKEQKTELLITPFAYMDGAFKDYMNYSIDDAKKYISKLLNNVKSVNGSFVSVWHNESLSGQKRWLGWREVYEHTFKSCF